MMGGNLLSPLPPRKANYKPILMVMLCSVLLGGGSCFGFVSTVSGNSSMSGIFAAGFLLCVLVFLGSIVGIVVKAVRESTRGGS
jgi:hypothetical protein